MYYKSPGFFSSENKRFIIIASVILFVALIIYYYQEQLSSVFSLSLLTQRDRDDIIKWEDVPDEMPGYIIYKNKKVVDDIEPLTETLLGSVMLKSSFKKWKDDQNSNVGIRTQTRNGNSKTYGYDVACTALNPDTEKLVLEDAQNSVVFINVEGHECTGDRNTINGVVVGDSQYSQEGELVNYERDKRNGLTESTSGDFDDAKEACNKTENCVGFTIGTNASQYTLFDKTEGCKSTSSGDTGIYYSKEKC